MINPEQIRAARGLLDWSTADLAKLSGMTINGLNKIERGHVHAQRETLQKLQEIFEAAGIEFLPNSGLRKKDRIIQTYEGDLANQQLLNDIYNTLKEDGGEVLISHVDEAIAIQQLSEDFLDTHLRRLKQSNITERMLVRAGDTNLVAPLHTYRAIPAEFFVATPMFIYGDKLALMSWQPVPRALIINDRYFAESARRLFNFAWNRAEQPTSVRNRK